MLILLLPAVSAREIVLQNDTIPDDGTASDGQVVWLGFPECAAIVLDPPADAEYPITIHTAQILLGSTGSQEHENIQATLAIKIIDPGTVPAGLYGFSDWSWPEEIFWLTVSSSYLNALNLNENKSGLFSLELAEEGRLAVYLCAPDPEWQSKWPYTSETDTSGLILDPAADGSLSFLYDGSGFRSVADAGLSGSWIIRLVGDDARDEEEPDTGGEEDTGTTELSLDQLTPDTAVLGTVAELILTGSGFEDGLVVSIGGLPLASVTLTEPDRLSGRSPSGLPVGTHDVLVTREDGQTATLAGAFTVTETPTDSEPGCSGCAAGGLRHSGLVALALLFGVKRRGSSAHSLETSATWRWCMNAPPAGVVLSG